MPFTLPKVAGTAALAVVASVLALPLATPASAAVVDKAFVVADADGDDFFGLTSQPLPSGSATTVVDEALPYDIHDLSSSADGSRVIFIQTNFSATTGEPTSEQVVVRDVSTRVVRALETRAFDGIHFLGAPALSPKGTEAVWELYDDAATTVTMRKGHVASGTSTTLKAGLTPYGFLSDTTVLAQDFDGNPFTMELTGTVTHAVTGLPAEALNVAVSPSLTRLAWGLYDTSVPAGQPLKAPMQVATVSLTSGVATVSGVSTIYTGLYNKQPSFSRDSDTVYWVRNSGTGLSGDVWRASFDGTTTPAAALATTTANEKDVAIAFTDDGTAPGALPTTAPAVLQGTSVGLSWSLPADTDLSATVISRTLGSVTKYFYVNAPLTTFTNTGLSLGSTYTYKLQALDRSGHYGPATTLTVTALQAAPTTADPTSRTSATTTFPVKFGPVRTPSATFTVDYAANGDTSWTNWLTDYAGLSASFSGAAGRSYTFRVQVKDGNGNASALTNSARAVVPFDQTKASFNGGGNVYSASAFLGSYRKLWRTTDYARVTLTGNRLQVVGSTCGTCGRFDLFDNGTWVASVDTYGSVSRLRQVLFTKYYSGIGTHSFSIKPRGTAGRPDVMLDGFAMRT